MRFSLKPKLLDLYILKKFLGTYFFSIILIMAIVVMFDVNEKLDAFLTAPFKETLGDYFLSFLPYFANQFSPLFVFRSQFQASACAIPCGSLGDSGTFVRTE